MEFWIKNVEKILKKFGNLREWLGISHYTLIKYMLAKNISIAVQSFWSYQAHVMELPLLISALLALKIILLKLPVSLFFIIYFSMKLVLMFLHAVDWISLENKKTIGAIAAALVTFFEGYLGSKFWNVIISAPDRWC